MDIFNRFRMAHTETIESEQTTETDMPESEETLEELPSIYYAYHHTG